MSEHCLIISNLEYNIALTANISGIIISEFVVPHEQTHLSVIRSFFVHMCFTFFRFSTTRYKRNWFFMFEVHFIKCLNTNVGGVANNHNFLDFIF